MPLALFCKAWCIAMTASEMFASSQLSSHSLVRQFLVVANSKDRQRVPYVYFQQYKLRPKCPIHLYAGVGSDEWAAEAGVAPPAPQGTTQLLDSILHVELHDFCHRFLADGV